MKIGYCGAKNCERAFESESGVVWYPGSVHEIEDSLARRMLAHPDVFVEADQSPTDQPEVTDVAESLAEAMAVVETAAQDEQTALIDQNAAIEPTRRPKLSLKR